MHHRSNAWPRVIVWLVHIALAPAIVAGLLAAPNLDARWQHNPTHFWLVALVAFANVGLALRISREAQLRNDARLLLVSLSYSVSAAFFGVHALATPKVLADGSNLGFSLAMPTGLLLGGLLAALSSIDWSDRTSIRLLERKTSAIVATLVVPFVWLYLSLNGLAPLGVAPEESNLRVLFTPLTFVGVALFLVAAVRYYRIHRAGPSPVALALVTSFVLLGETLAIVGVSRAWQLSWWTWHVMILIGYGYVAYAAFIQFNREGRAGALFANVGLASTLEQLRSEFRDALDELVSSIGPTGSLGDAERSANQLGASYGLTDAQTRVLAGAAEALAHERRQSAVLSAMAEIGRHPLADVSESDLADLAATGISEALGAEITYSTVTEVADPNVTVWSVSSHERQLGALQTVGTLGARDDELVTSFAAHLGTVLVNRGLYRDLRRLFGRYVSPEIASRLLADPSSSELGGAMVETTVLFADLRGFTTFTESMQHPEDVVHLLNTYFAAAVPILLEEGGTVDKFVGDAVMALFNTPTLQSDHAVRAVRAATRMQAAIDELAAAHADWPRFRIGINTGSALVGNIGSSEMRNYTAVGDAVNVAARLETAAEPGHILMGATTYELVRHVVTAEHAGDLDVKGKSELVTAYRLLAIAEPRAPSTIA